MVNKKKKLITKILLLLATLVLLAVLAVAGIKIAEMTTGPSNDTSQISVALYPYVPDPELLEKLVSEYWAEIHPDIPLNFVAWDCYVPQSDMSNIDVVMYDAIYTSYLAENNLIQPIKRSDIKNIDSFIDFSLDAGLHNDKLYGVPTLACGYFLIHEKDDLELAAANNIPEVYNVIGPRKTQTLIPEDRSEGFLVNFSNNVGFYYLDALTDFAGVYNNSISIPTPLEQENAIEIIEQIIAMAGKEHTLNGNENLFQNAMWFNEGKSRAMFGHSEDLSFMTDILDDVAIKSVSFSDTEDTSLYFIDTLSINSQVKNPKKIKLCLELINLIASDDLLYELSLGEGNPPYLLTVKHSNYPKLAEQYPMYNRLEEIVTDKRNRPYRIGPEVYEIDRKITSLFMNQ